MSVEAHKARQYVRDFHGRFSRVPGVSAHVPRVKRPHVRKPNLGLNRGTRAPAITLQDSPAMAIRALPPEWSKITGDNAKRDGMKLWKRKKAGEFDTKAQFYAAADAYHREFRKSQPNANYASKNQIANACYRHELEETGHVTYFPEPGEAPRVAKKTATPPAAPKVFSHKHFLLRIRIDAIFIRS